MKRFLLGFAIALLAACGDDESSFAPRDEDSSFSIEEESSSSSVILSSSSRHSGLDPESSSTKGDGGSSSAMTSSSAASSSSVTQQSSSSVVSSSSETTESSSSEYVPFDHSKTLGWQKLDGGYKTFTDSRNGRSYYYITITGRDTADNVASVTVMAENLNVGVDVPGDQDQNDDTKIERYCYNNDTTKCDEFGGLYQWAEMMQLPSECNTKSCVDQIKPNHQGICPDGWRLLTYNDFYIILHSDGNTHGIEGLRSTFGFGGYNTTGYSLVGAGYNWNYTFLSLTEGTYWFYPEESDENPKKGVGSYTYDSATTVERKGSYLKKHGFSVRCVTVENQAE